MSPRARAAVLAVVLAVPAAGCYEFRLAGPEDPPPVPAPRLVSVTVEYRQPAGCLGGGRCEDLVVFFGSWMRPGTEFALTADPGHFVWRGVATGVPVNFPPRENPQPYQVRIYDPHLLVGPTGGFTGDRITFGSEFLYVIESPGRPDVHALAYVDENGLGHNAY
ncbi:MAG: hypothetical protein HY317_03095 [Acidobacteria bacterium]|nr:hypothetical protein [Acidobacteriota bacterium]